MMDLVLRHKQYVPRAQNIASSLDDIRNAALKAQNDLVKIVRMTAEIHGTFVVNVKQPIIALQISAQLRLSLRHIFLSLSRFAKHDLQYTGLF